MERLRIVICRVIRIKTCTTKSANAALLLSALLFTLVGAEAQEKGARHQRGPDALVAGLYKRHDQKHSPFFQRKSRALVDRYFDRNLSDLIWRDAVNSKGEVGALDFDPLYNAQDTDIKEFFIQPPEYKDGKALVSVKFENVGQKETVVFILALKSSQWKIENIRYRDGIDLVGILKGP